MSSIVLLNSRAAGDSPHAAPQFTKRDRTNPIICVAPERGVSLALFFAADSVDMSNSQQPPIPPAPDEPRKLLTTIRFLGRQSIVPSQTRSSKVGTGPHAARGGFERRCRPRVCNDFTYRAGAIYPGKSAGSAVLHFDFIRGN